MTKSKTRKPRSKAAVYKRMAMEEKLFQNALYADLATAHNRGLNNGYGTAVLIMFWLLHTEYGFGKKRLALLMRKINDFCIEFLGPGPDGQQKPQEGTFSGISLRDIANALNDECGVSINPETWEMSIDGVEVVKEDEEHDGIAEADAAAG